MRATVTEWAVGKGGDALERLIGRSEMRGGVDMDAVGSRL